MQSSETVNKYFLSLFLSAYFFPSLEYQDRLTIENQNKVYHMKCWTWNMINKPFKEQTRWVLKPYDLTRPVISNVPQRALDHNVDNLSGLVLASIYPYGNLAA